MKILCFAGSNSQQSINKQLVEYAAAQTKAIAEGPVDINVLDLNQFEMPIYSIDREQAAGIPEEAQRFNEQIRSADALIISFAEHNGSFTVAYKNIFDWCSRINPKVYDQKPCVLLATSPGPGGARSVLKAATESFPYFGAEICGTLSIPSFGQQFDSEANRLNDPVMNDELLSMLKTLLKRAESQLQEAG